MDANLGDPFCGLRATRPRLMADAAAIQRVKAAVAGSEPGEALKAKIIHKAQKALDERPAKRHEGDLRDIAKAARKRLQVLGLTWLMGKNDEQLVKRAKDELLAICAFREWNPGYFLGTAGMTLAAAIGYDWFHKHLTGPERRKIAAAIVEKGLKPGLEQLKGYPKPAWPSKPTNWNIVCNAGLMIGVLALAGEEQQEDSQTLREVFERGLNSVATGIGDYSPDGSWDEGPGYWCYATEHIAYLLSSLKTALGHEFGLGDLPGLRNTGFFRMHAEGGAAAEEIAGKLFNYSDCAEEHGASWAMRWLSHRYDEPIFNSVALADNQSNPMDLLWFSPVEPESGATIPRNAYFRGSASVAMLRGSGTDKSARYRPWKREGSGDVYVGIRAGINSRDDPHGHLDLGSFVLDAQRVRWASDLQHAGESKRYAADYDLPGYFDIDLDRRFRYYRTGTAGHNTLVVNGFNQPIGVYSDIIAFRDQAPDRVVAVIDLTAAYPDCLRVRRGFALVEGQHVLIVDELTPKREMTVAWQMHTRAAACGERIVQLTQPFDGKERQFYVQVLEPDSAGFSIEDAPVSQPRETPNEGVRKLVANFSRVTKPLRIAVQLSATPCTTAGLRELLAVPLWHWIEWAGELRREKERRRYKEQISAAYSESF